VKVKVYGEAILSKQLLVSADRHWMKNGIVLQCLKDIGAPVIGTTFLEVDTDNYTWESEVDQNTGDRIIIWRRK
jgi:hypothetical protein